MSKRDETIMVLESVNNNIKNIPDDLELEKMNSVVSIQKLTILCDIALSLAIIADNTMSDVADITEQEETSMRSDKEEKSDV